MTEQQSHRKALLLMICVPVLWSIAGIFTRHLEVVRSFEVTFWRSLSAALFVAATLIWQHKSQVFQVVRKVGKLGLISSVLWGLIFICFMLAMTMTTVANTLIVDSVSPLLTVFFAWIFLKEKASFRTWVAIVLAFVGMVWMFAGSMAEMSEAHLAGMAIAFIVPVAFAANYIIFKKAGQEIELIPTVFLGGALSALVMLPLALPLQSSMHDIAIMMTLGVFQLGLPCMLLIRAAKFLSPAEIALLSLLEVLLGPLWVWWGVGEVPAQATIVGGFIVLLGLVLHELAPMQQYERLKQIIYFSNKDSGN